MKKDESLKTNIDNNEDVNIFFSPSGRQGKVKKGISVLNAARKLGVDIDSVCGGRAMCGRCQINVSEGQFDKYGIVSKNSNLSDKSESEKKYISKRNLDVKKRLSCQAIIKNSVVIDVPQESQIHKQVIRKAVDDRDVKIDPLISLLFVEVNLPDMNDPSSDFARLKDSILNQWPDKSNPEITADIHVLQKLQSTLRKENWRVTVALRKSSRIIDIWPGFKEQVFGIALDVGSTTISAHLVDLHSGVTIASNGRMNPQIKYGEDLMSRVSYVMMNQGGEKELADIVRKGIQEIIVDVAEENNIDFNDILEITFVGNPVMHHLLLGINPIELGGAPFALSLDNSMECLSSEINIHLNPGSRIYALPCIAGHVGADAAAAALAEQPHKKSEISLIIDVGTNAEIILGNDKNLLAASSPTGPAFEGAQIICGQRAAAGAIERVRIDPETFEPKYKIIGVDKWSNENGFEEKSANIGITGICGSGIIEVLGEMFLTGILNKDGIINGEIQKKTNRIELSGRTYSYRLSENVVIYQNDVRAIQLAKAALNAGFKLLMEKMNITFVDRVFLAGAFGSHIDPKYAMVLGIVPDCNLENVRSSGNSAGAGARLALLSNEKRLEVENLVKKIKKIETAVEPKFQEFFVDAMGFPHTTDPYEMMRKQLNLKDFSLEENTRKNTRKRSRKKTN